MSTNGLPDLSGRALPGRPAAVCRNRSGAAIHVLTQPAPEHLLEAGENAVGLSDAAKPPTRAGPAMTPGNAFPGLAEPGERKEISLILYPRLMFRLHPHRREPRGKGRDISPKKELALLPLTIP